MSMITVVADRFAGWDDELSPFVGDLYPGRNYSFATATLGTTQMSARLR